MRTLYLRPGANLTWQAGHHGLNPLWVHGERGQSVASNGRQHCWQPTGGLSVCWLGL